MADWSKHKEYCQSRAQVGKDYGIWDNPEYVKPYYERASLAQDWLELYKNVVDEAFTSVISTASPPFDFHRSYVRFRFTRDVEEKNPSKALILQSAELVDLPDKKPIMVLTKEQGMMRNLIRASEDMHSRLKENREYLSAISCACKPIILRRSWLC